jgi:hypothetical protein
MSELKLSPDLFLEAAELERFKKFLDTDGFRKNVLDNSVNFGLVKSYHDRAFVNARVTRDTDVSGGKTVKVSEIKAIDQDGLFIYSAGLRNIPLSADGFWYWLKMSLELEPSSLKFSEECPISRQESSF